MSKEVITKIDIKPILAYIFDMEMLMNEKSKEKECYKQFYNGYVMGLRDARVFCLAQSDLQKNKYFKGDL